MANILSLITIGEKDYQVVDNDPAISGGTAAPIGDIAIWDNGTVGRAYLKTGAASTAWDQINTVATSGTVNTGAAGRLPVYAAAGNALSDTYTQNAFALTTAYVAQPTRSAAIAYTIPNPGDAITAASFILSEGAQTINGAKTFTSAIDMSNQKIVNLGTPTNAGDAVNKGYIDGIAQGLTWKNAVRAASTANIAALTGALTIDGVTLVAGDRVLVKNQTTQTNNGIYVVATGAWTRALDSDTGAELVGAAVFVDEGTINADTAWVQTAVAPITLGTTNITFVQFAGAGTYTAGNGLTLVGTQFSVLLATASGLQFTGGALDHLLDGSTLSKSASGLRVATGGITNNEVAAGAAIARSKIAVGTANQVVINDGTGALSSEAQLAMSRGGTNAALVAAAGGIVYSTASALAISTAGNAGQAFISGGTGTPGWFSGTGVVHATAGVLSASNVLLTSEVTGILPVANGGTNSGTTLNNSRIMVSAGGAIVEAAALTNGQLLVGSTGAAPVAANITVGAFASLTVTNGAGTIVIDAIQDIRVTASPTWVNATLSGKTLGSVIFAGTGGALAQNNANLFWDNTNARLGLGTAAPARLLDVNGTSIVRGAWRFADAGAANANFEMFQAQVTTTNATVTTLATIAIPTDSSVVIEAKIVGRRTGGTAGAAQDAATYVRTARVKNVASTVTLPTLQADFTSEDQTPWNGTITVSGTNALISVQGAANNTISWTVTYSVITL